MIAYLLLTASFFGRVASVTEVARREIGADYGRVEVEVDKNGMAQTRVRKEGSHATSDGQKMARSELNQFKGKKVKAGKGREAEAQFAAAGAQPVPAFQTFATPSKAAAPVKFVVPAKAKGTSNVANVANDVSQVFTAVDLASMTIPNDPNSCYIGLFDGPDTNSAGGVYLISPAWFQIHPGGTFANQDWCGTPRFGWTDLNPSHQNFATPLQNNADFLQAGTVIATYMGEFSYAQVFTLAELASMTIPNDPNSCYIGLFDGSDASSPGGVYLISPEWFASHPGGTFADQDWCGTPRFGWTDVNPSHQNFATPLQNNENFVQAGSVIATYMGELSLGLNGIAGVAGVNTPGVDMWTLQDLQARNNYPADPNSCFIAIYDGATSFTNGGIYLITPEWIQEHLGGPLSTLGSCGTFQPNWLARNSMHPNWATNLAEGTDIVVPDNLGLANPLVATYVGEFDDGSNSLDIGVAQGGSSHVQISLMAFIVAMLSFNYVLGQP